MLHKSYITTKTTGWKSSKRQVTLMPLPLVANIPNDCVSRFLSVHSLSAVYPNHRSWNSSPIIHKHSKFPASMKPERFTSGRTLTFIIILFIETKHSKVRVFLERASVLKPSVAPSEPRLSNVQTGRRRYPQQHHVIQLQTNTSRGHCTDRNSGEIRMISCTAFSSGLLSSPQALNSVVNP